MQKKNIQEVQKILEKMSFKAQNLKPFMHTIGEKVVTASMDAFANESDPITGMKWSPTKASMKKSSKSSKSFQRKKNNKKVLQDQGMRGGLMSSVDYEATSKSTTITASKEYAATHQFGDDTRNIEQRRFMPIDDSGDISDKLRDDIIEEFEEFILEEF